MNIRIDNEPVIVIILSSIGYQRSILNESFLIHAPLNHNLGTGEGSQNSYHHSSSEHPHVMNKWRILNGGCQVIIRKTDHNDVKRVWRWPRFLHVKYFLHISKKE